jgi:hypothetical protein
MGRGEVGGSVDEGWGVGWGGGEGVLVDGILGCWKRG